MSLRHAALQVVSGVDAASLRQLLGCPWCPAPHRHVGHLVGLSGQGQQGGEAGASAALPWTSPGPSGLIPSPQTLALVLSSQVALSLVAPVPLPCPPQTPRLLQHSPRNVVRFWREEVVFLSSCHLASTAPLAPAPFHV